MLRRTKIVATLGPATDRPDELTRMVSNGLDVARINFSHGDAQQHRDRINRVREEGVAHNRYIGIMVDLQGPKIRISGFKDGEVMLNDGDQFVLDTECGVADGDQQRVGITYKNLLNEIDVGDMLLLDDGNITLEVEAITSTEAQTVVINGGKLSNAKGLNKQGGGLSAAALTEKDLEDIKVAAEVKADYIAVSFVRDANDVNLARELFQKAGGHGGVVAKIERAEAIGKIDEIIEAADAVMIARGDLGVEVGDAELPGIQKKIVREARANNRAVITATQMMESMIDSPQPTRAEVLDVANAVMDGTDAVMLSGETAVGKHPARVIKTMVRICAGAERQRITMISNHRLESKFNSIEEAIAMAGMYTANHLGVGAIVAMTESGATAKLMSRISSGIPIFAMSRDVETVCRVSLYRGVYPILCDHSEMTSAEADQSAIKQLKKIGVINEGDRVIVTKGDKLGISGGTNSMRILQA